MRATNGRSLLVLLTTAALLAGCGGGVPSQTPFSPSMTTPGATTLTAPSTVGTPDPATLRWAPIGTIDSAQIDGLVAFDRGYIAWETGYSGQPAAWFSPDGNDWARTELTEPACHGEGTGGAVWDGASHGAEVMLVGQETTRCGEDPSYGPASWLTSDGVTWQKSTSVPAPSGLYGLAYEVWAVPEGWEAGIISSDPPDFTAVAVWRSSDGVTWDEIAKFGHNVLYAVVATPTGTRLGSFSGRDRQWLATSTDGRTWREIAAPRHEPVGAIFPASSDGRDPWVVVFDTTIAASSDLVTWEQRSFSMQEISAVVSTRYGLVAIWTIPCFEGGEYTYDAPATECPPHEYTTSLSADARTWIDLGSRVPVSSLADGPAGVIGISQWEDRGPGGLTVWRLGP